MVSSEQKLVAHRPQIRTKSLEEIMAEEQEKVKQHQLQRLQVVCVCVCVSVSLTVSTSVSSYCNQF